MKNQNQILVEQFQHLFTNWVIFRKGNAVTENDVVGASGLSRMYIYHNPDPNYNFTSHRLEVCKLLNQFAESAPEKLQILVGVSVPGVFQSRLTLNEFLEMDAKTLMGYLYMTDTKPTPSVPGFNNLQTPHVSISIKAEVEHADGLRFDEVARIYIERKQNTHYNGWALYVHHYEYLQLSDEWMTMLAELVDILREKDNAHQDPFAWSYSNSPLFYHTQKSDQEPKPIHFESAFPALAPLTSVTSHVNWLRTNANDGHMLGHLNTWGDFLSHYLSNNKLVKSYKVNDPCPFVCKDTFNGFATLLKGYGVKL